MPKIITRSKIVMPDGITDIFHEGISEVGIDDLAGGLFITISQSYNDKIHTIQIDPEEWPSVKQAVEEMLEVIKELEPNPKT